METSLVNRLQATLLAAATVALFLLAIGNFAPGEQIPTASDGVWWVESHGGMVAQRVDSDGPGKRAGIQVHDLLTAVGDSPIHKLSDIDLPCIGRGIYSKANYSITRDNIPLDNPVEVIPGPRP